MEEGRIEMGEVAALLCCIVPLPSPFSHFPLKPSSASRVNSQINSKIVKPHKEDPP